jgi:hypothetical protein
MSNRFPHLVSNDGKQFYFGQDLAEVEKIFGVSARQHLPETARAAQNQRILETKELILTFDTGKLMHMEFLQDFNFERPLTPYADDWKNLDCLPFKKEMSREEAVGHLSTWEKRVSVLGARKIECGDDLSSNEFSTYSFNEEDEDMKTLGIDWNVFGINMGKSRRTSRGGLWTDGWSIEFTTARDAKLNQRPIGRFRSVSAFCDEFNTAARK